MSRKIPSNRQCNNCKSSNTYTRPDGFKEWRKSKDGNYYCKGCYDREIQWKDKDIEVIKCQCGCNESIPAVNKRGEVAKYKHSHNPRQKGPDNKNWKGGKILHDEYIRIRVTNHPRSNNGYVLEHVLVMEKHLGRYIKPDEIVHHINGDKLDNRIENLQLMTQSEHSSHHATKSHKSGLIPKIPRSEITGRFIKTK